MAKRKGPDGPDEHPPEGARGGYKRPPKHGQIKPGEVRNPYGRNGKPKVKDPLRAALDRTVSITIDGATKKATMETVMYHRAAEAATKGDIRALAVLARASSIGAGKNASAPTAEELAAEAAEYEKKNKLTAQLMENIEFIFDLSKVGLITAGDGKIDLEPWVWDALRAYRESLGENPDPGRGSWKPSQLKD